MSLGYHLANVIDFKLPSPVKQVNDFKLPSPVKQVNFTNMRKV